MKIMRQLFHLWWTFVERVELEEQLVTIRFNESSLTPGPFVARLDVTDLSTGKRSFWQKDDYFANKIQRVSLPLQTPASTYRIRFTLDGATAFADAYVPESDIPF